MSAEVVVYTTDYCPYCTRAMALLKKKKIPFTEVDVSDRPDLRAWLIEASGQRTVPQVFINGKAMGGFTDIAEADRKGALDPLLATAPSPGDPETRR